MAHCHPGGDDGAEAAWLIVQHAIALTAFQRRCLRLLEEAAATGSIPLWQPAFLLDRVLTYEGKPQVYGTSFDWDEEGLMSPRPSVDPAGVDARRAAVGLPPIAEATADHRMRSAGQTKPASYAERQRNFASWPKGAGWL